MSFLRTTLTIAISTTDSQDYAAVNTFSNRPLAVMIIAPATLPETVHIVVVGAANSGRLQGGGNDIVLAAGKATQIMVLTGTTIKLVATGTVAAARVFDLEISG